MDALCHIVAEGPLVLIYFVVGMAAFLMIPVYLLLAAICSIYLFYVSFKTPQRKQPMHYATAIILTLALCVMIAQADSGKWATALVFAIFGTAMYIILGSKLLPFEKHASSSSDYWSRAYFY